MAKKKTQGPTVGRFKTTEGYVEFSGTDAAIYELLDVLSENNAVAAIIKRVALSDRKLEVELGPKDE